MLGATSAELERAKGALAQTREGEAHAARGAREAEARVGELREALRASERACEAGAERARGAEAALAAAVAARRGAEEAASAARERAAVASEAALAARRAGAAAEARGEAVARAADEAGAGAREAMAAAEAQLDAMEAACAERCARVEAEWRGRRWISLAQVHGQKILLGTKGGAHAPCIDESHGGSDPVCIRKCEGLFVRWGEDGECR